MCIRDRRTVTTFTATAGQTTFTVTYTQGLVDVYYNGSCLAQSEYTATNGTSIILATACQLNDIVVVYAYSYSVGAYSGIGGSGTATQVAYFASSSTINSSSSLYWDNTNARLGIGTSVPAYTLDISGSINTYLASIGTYFRGGSNNAARQLLISSSTTTNAGDTHTIDAQSGTGVLQFAVTSSPKMTILASGNVGIGTSSPAQILHISGTSIRPQIEGTGNGGYSSLRFVGKNSGGTSRTFEIGLNITADDVWQITNGSSAFLNVTTDGNVGIGLTGVYSNVRLMSRGVDATASNYAFRAETSAAANLMYIRNDGLIVTGLLSGSPYNYTTGSAANMYVSGGGELQRSTSSLKYKTDVRNYDKGLTEVLQMRPVYYKGKNDGDTQFAGLIAEEIHELGLTEFVQYAEDGSPDALAYANMIALLTKAIQEMNTKIIELEKIVATK